MVTTTSSISESSSRSSASGSKKKKKQFRPANDNETVDEIQSNWKGPLVPPPAGTPPPAGSQPRTPRKGKGGDPVKKDPPNWAKPQAYIFNKEEFFSLPGAPPPAGQPPPPPPPPPPPQQQQQQPPRPGDPRNPQGLDPYFCLPGKK
ncbi:hypothetical protein Y032_0088g2150 [Ancylostoma ceylanicum]|uniref:Uncharacterized protein n=1 Tax=Ancylostoma ceylanicum TaxID=53326 RepID=A0A016TNW2_9BILA|nr:hypothetical protein Y032_0088g2150 [Ancylostoma ceylanicum]EYC04347.1 hypothetical protein Y032_0088g2150 [Ancylostoma ceylanicum]